MIRRDAPSDTVIAIDPAVDAVATTIVAQVYPTTTRAILAFAVLMLAEFFYSWAWNTVDVLRPFMRDSLGLTLTQAGSGYSAQGAGALIGAIVIGQLADRVGRRAMLATVMVGYGLTLVAGTLVTSYPTYLAQRFVLGLFMGGIFPIVVGIYVGLFAANVGGRLAGTLNAVFSSAISLLGIAGGLAAGDWRLLLWLGGMPPVLLAGFAFLLLPASADARRTGQTGASASVPVAELFAPGLRRQTLLLACLTGLNFFGYQAFSGWQTTYLRDVRHLDAIALGGVVGWSFAANIVGGFFWGWTGDRFGRRFNALGFLGAAVLIGLYLAFARTPLLLSAMGAAYGFMLSASVIWGPWLTELYPAHLKSTAASIFNWGRVVSFFAPLITGVLAEQAGLTWTMALASVAFSAAAIIWLSLPETHPHPLLGGKTATGRRQRMMMPN